MSEYRLRRTFADFLEEMITTDLLLHTKEEAITKATLPLMQCLQHDSNYLTGTDAEFNAVLADQSEFVVVCLELTKEAQEALSFLTTRAAFRKRHMDESGVIDYLIYLYMRSVS